MQIKTSTQLKQQLFRGHVYLGIGLSLFMYVSIFFGLFGIFMPYLQTWEKPSRHFPARPLEQITYEPMIDAVLADPKFPRDRIFIDLPGYKKDPAVRISHQFTAQTIFNPATGIRVEDEGRRSNLAMFLNGMHYARPLKTWGVLFFGILSPGFMFLTAGGVLMILVFKYRDKGKSGQTLFSKWHRKIFTWTFAPLAMILICASVMGLSFHGLGPMAGILTKGEVHNIRPLIGPILFPEEPRPKLTNRRVPMQPIAKLLQKAGQIAPELQFKRLVLDNWGDESAKIRLEGINPQRPFLNGVTVKPWVVLQGRDGKFLARQRVSDHSWGMRLLDGVYYLHLLFGVGIAGRILVFAFMLASGLGIGFGVLLWMEKKKRHFKGKLPFYHWMSKLSLAVMLGVLPATGFFINLHWLLPLDLPQRLTWQQGLFFDTWLAGLAWAFYRISSARAAREFLLAGGALFLAAPLLHWLNTGMGPLALARGQMSAILWVDLSFALAGTLLLFSGSRISRTGPAGAISNNDAKR